MSSRHLGQYKGDFYIMDKVLTAANLPPTKAPVTRMRFQIVPLSYRSVLISLRFQIDPCWFAYSNCLRFHNRLHRFRVNRR